MSRRNRHYYYSSAPQSSVGLMRCCVCYKSITEGDFRYHEGRDGYVTCHRACCADDHEWARRDRAEIDAAAHNEAFVAACIAFREKWGIPDLDDYIPEQAR